MVGEVREHGVGGRVERGRGAAPHDVLDRHDDGEADGADAGDPGAEGPDRTGGASGLAERRRGLLRWTSDGSCSVE